MKDEQYKNKMHDDENDYQNKSEDDLVDDGSVHFLHKRVMHHIQRQKERNREQTSE